MDGRAALEGRNGINITLKFVKHLGGERQIGNLWEGFRLEIYFRVA